MRTLSTSTLAAAVWLLALMVPSRAAAQAGTLDTTFDGDGKVVSDLGLNEFGVAMAFQGDKILVAGFRSGMSGITSALARYTTTGSLDTSFGTGGWVTDFAGVSFHDIAVQQDGKIVAVASSGGDFFVVRYLPDGGPDVSFVPTDLGGFDSAEAVAIQADGKIVVAGTSFLPGNADFAVVRYTTTGSLDTTFGTAGKVLTNLGGFDAAFSVALDDDGRIVVGGSRSSGGILAFALARYDTLGMTDPAFGTGGVVVTPITGGDAIADVAIQSDGKIVAVGHSLLDFFTLARYDGLDGSLDTSFGGIGWVLTDFGGTDAATDVAFQTNGKIVVAGTSDPGGETNRFALARYNPDGFPDATFGTDGKVLTDFRVQGSPFEVFAFAIANAVAIQADGNIVAAGGGRTGEHDDHDFMLARYIGGNTPAGTGIVVESGRVTVTFQNITQPGDTLLTTSATGPQPPEGFSLGNPPTYFDISTTAIFSGLVHVCIDYTGIAFDSEMALQLMHFDGTWMDVTTTLDTVNNIICGDVTSLSPFIIGEIREPSFIPATVDINPATVNKKSKGSYITVYVEFPEGLANPADIDVSTVTLSALGATAHVAAGSPTSVGDANGDGIVDLTVKFDRATIQSWFAGPASATVHVEGRFVDGSAFKGEDTILVIDEGAEHENEGNPGSVR